MEQYEKSGPKVAHKTSKEIKTDQIIDDLRRHIESQDQRIKDLERDLRKLRNDMRMAIATANTINANRQRNG